MSMNNLSARSLLHDMLAPKKAPVAKPAEEQVLDAAVEGMTDGTADAVAKAEAAAAIPPEKKTPEESSMDTTAALDMDKTVPEETIVEVEVLDDATNYGTEDIALQAVAAVQEWAETTADDLDEGEGMGDRLFSLLAGVADQDMDGEISDAEADVINMAAQSAAEYMVAKGVPEDDAVALLSDFDNELANSVQELVLSAMPEGDEAAADEIDAFVFGDDAGEGVFDSVVLDATYKKKIVIRAGKKVRINKRVSGHIRLSAKQKVAVRKMIRKSHSARAKARRARSMKIRSKSSLAKK